MEKVRPSQKRLMSPHFLKRHSSINLLKRGKSKLKANSYRELQLI